jgi:hypothetical protein
MADNGSLLIWILALIIILMGIDQKPVDNEKNVTVVSKKVDKMTLKPYVVGR